MAIAVIALALVLPSAASAIEPDGSFIRTPSDFKIYRIAGGAPIHVHTCAPLGGCPGLKDVPNLNGYSAVPANGTHLRIANGSRAGLVATVAGGVLVGVSSGEACAQLPGCSNAHVNLDSGGFGAYESLHRDMADRTLVRLRDHLAASCCAVVRIAGGHPLRVFSCAPLDGCAGFVDVDRRGFASYSAGHPRIADGAFVRYASGSHSGQTRRAAGGALLRVTDCAPLGGCTGAVDVEARSIDEYMAASPTPADDTILAGAPSGTRWRVTGGRRFALPPGSQGGVLLNDDGIAEIPSGDPPPAPPAAPKPRTWRFKIALRGRKLVVEPVLRGSRIAVLCRKRCGGPRRGAVVGRVRKTKPRKRVAPVRLRRIDFRLGTRFTVRVIAPGRVGRFTTYRIGRLAGVLVAKPGRRGCFDGRLVARC